MRRKAVLALLPVLFLLSGCGHPNIWADTGIDVLAPPQADDRDRVHEVAASLGFEQVQDFHPVVPVSRTNRGTGEWLEQWEWRERRSTHINLYRLLDNNGYEDCKVLGRECVPPGTYTVGFEDMETDAFGGVKDGPCDKYLEFVKAMKAKFGTDRLLIRSETCKFSL